MLWYSKKNKKPDCITFFIYLWGKGFRENFYCHIKQLSAMEKSQKIARQYSCEMCNYNTSNFYDYNKHLSTRKHSSNDLAMKNLKKSESHKKIYVCEVCNKTYCDYSGLWRHKKKCEEKSTWSPTSPSNNESKPPEITIELVYELVKQNKELQDLLRDELKQAKNVNSHNTNTNSNNNNSFNLNFFLNEQCKDAVNLVDFVESLKVGIKDLERTGKLGYVDGISSIFLDGLKEMDVYTRPIHCTELKRETVYVKDQDKWEKEDDDKSKLKTAIKKVARKNLQQLSNWQKENPECMDTLSEASDQYIILSQQSLGGVDEKEECKYQNTIIKNVLKDVAVTK